ncbi:helix-turn-helix domain-containing protein [Paenibacillus puerhi]|uniref:helix-turn-helix domain-containing protein n=1 Tax=Paenibacillus puerhi TaxID=2692622 RepID=UPI00135ADDCB|nr:AraC family transcriptional regulator [Paenibacillus puerhi]
MLIRPHVQHVPTVRRLPLLSSVRLLKRSAAYLRHVRRVPAHLLCFVLEGAGSIRVNGRTLGIEPMRLYSLYPGSTLETTPATKAFQAYVIVIENITARKQGRSWIVESSLHPLPDLPEGCIRSREPKQLLAKIIALHETFRQPASREKGLPEMQLQALLDILIRESTAASDDQAEPAAGDGIDASILYMERHYHDKISRERLADIAGLTPNAFCRGFKRRTGCSPTQYLNQLRIQRAKEVLSPSLSVKEAAVSVGYSSEYYFSRIFKETVGLSPSLFIKREKLRVATASRTHFHHNLADIGVEAVAAIDGYRYPEMEDNPFSMHLLGQLEQLKLAGPDLIIADYTHTYLLDRLKQIAPTIIVQHELDWRRMHRNIAGLVGREQEAVRSIDELDRHAQNARERLRSLAGGQSVTILQPIKRLIRIQGTGNHPLNELIYQELGLRPGGSVPSHKMREEWLPEQLPPLASDHLFMIRHTSDPEVEDLLMKLQETAASPISPAAAPSRSYIIPNWLVMSWTPQGRLRVIHQLFHHLTGQLLPL